MKIGISKDILKRIGIIVIGIFILLLSIWLGFSFFSMKSNSPHLKTSINLKSDEINSKVTPVSSIRDVKYIQYKYSVNLEEVSFDRDSFDITGYATNFLENYEDIENAKFKYSLDKGKGNFDFTKLEDEQPITLIFEYRVDRDLRYFFEYSGCTLKKVYSDIFDINNTYANGYCMVKREPYKWGVEIIENAN